MLKRIIRNDYLQKRIQLSEEDVQSKTSKIVRQFSRFAVPPCNYLLSYYPLTERNEFNVELCVEVMRTKYPRLKVAWPRIETETLSMEAYVIDNNGLFAKNKYNILEPISGEWISPELIEIIFVPLVVFDKRGYRVGYGKGYYDRYLTRCRADVVKIGFSYFEAVEAIKDITEFDVPLNFCITPSRVYEF